MGYVIQAIDDCIANFALTHSKHLSTAHFFTITVEKELAANLRHLLAWPARLDNEVISHRNRKVRVNQMNRELPNNFLIGQF